MNRIHREHLTKIAVLVLYIAILLAVYAFVHLNGIHFRDVPRLVAERVDKTGVFGPLLMVAMFAVQTIIPFSGLGLAVISGSIYGPWIGILVTLLGMNIAASISFLIGRFLGRHLISEYERGWVKKYDDLLTEQGFISMFMMRALHFPFDFVSLGAGMTRMTYRQFAAGTFLGSLPGLVTLTVLGDAFDEPRSWFLFVFLLVVSVGMVWFVRRSAWAKARLFKQIDPENLG